MTDVCIGLGSNIGDSKNVFLLVIEELSRIGSHIQVSSLYKTSPQDFLEQPDFLNCGVKIGWNSSFLVLLHTLLEIEQKHGRERDKNQRFGPRTIDLDILWIQGYTFQTPNLIAPHPRLTSRAFALIPFLELFPDAINPIDGTIYQIPQGIEATQGIRLVSW